MQTLKELKQSWNDRVVANCQAFSMEESYDEMLNGCYSFKSVGGPFGHMKPASVLEEMDPTAYRCGLNDYADSMRDTAVELSNGDYYTVDDCNEVKAEIETELESELEELQADEDSDKEELEALETLLDDFRALEPSDL